MSETFDPYRIWLSIPLGKRPPTHYQLLGVSPDELDAAVINAAVMRQSAYVRNFQIGKHAEEAARILGEIQAAKACLLDPAKRARYDAELRAAQASNAASPAVRAAMPVYTAPAPAIDLEALAAAVGVQDGAVPGRPLAKMGKTPRKTQFVRQLPLAVFGGVLILAVLIAFSLPRGGQPEFPPEANIEEAVEVIVNGEPSLISEPSSASLAPPGEQSLDEPGSAKNARSAVPDLDGTAIWREILADGNFAEGCRVLWPSGDVLLADGSLKHGTTREEFYDQRWSLEVAGQAEATAQLDQQEPHRALRIQVSKPSAEGWHVQLGQGMFAWEEGKNYLLRFRAKSDAPREIWLQASVCHEPFAPLWSATVGLTTEWKNYEFTITPSASDNQGRFVFSGLATQQGTVWLADVSLRRRETPKKEAVDLLALIDPVRDAVEGKWRREGSALAVESGQNVRIEVPYDFPDAYRLALVVEPHGDHFVIGLPTADGRLELGIDVGNGTTTGIWNGKNHAQVASDVGPSGPKLIKRQHNEIVCEVAKEYVHVHCNGTQVINFPTNGEPSALNDWWKTPNPLRLMIGSRNSHLIHALRLEPLSDRLLLSPQPPALAPPAAEKKDVDLLSLIDPARDAKVGGWRIENGILVGSSTHFARLELPYTAPAEYDLAVQIEPTPGNPEFFVGLVFAGRQAAVRMDAEGKGLLGINVDHLRLLPLVSPDNGHRRLAEGKRNDVLCRVRRGRIEVVCNGQLAIWAVDAEQLPRAEIWGGVEINAHLAPPVTAIKEIGPWKSGNEPKLFVGGANPHRIHKITLTPQLSMGPTWPALAEVPDASQVAAAQKKVVDQFAKEWSAAKDPGKKGELLSKLCDVGKQPLDLVLRFAALQEAWQRAARHGNIRMCCEAIDQARSAFEMDVLQLKTTEIISALPAVRDPGQGDCTISQLPTNTFSR